MVFTAWSFVTEILSARYETPCKSFSFELGELDDVVDIRPYLECESCTKKVTIMKAGSFLCSECDLTDLEQMRDQGLDPLALPICEVSENDCQKLALMRNLKR